MPDRYTVAQAQRTAALIVDRYGPLIVKAAELRGYPAFWLAGLTGMENPACHEWPSKLSMRFEPGVYSHLKAVANPLKVWAKSYNGITRERLNGLKDVDIRALSTSYGQTQIMGYYVLTALRSEGDTWEETLAQLRNPKLHYYFTTMMFNADPRIVKYNRWHDSHLPANRDLAFKHVAHIWNSGRDWNGKPGWAPNGKGNIKTYSPAYMDNCLMVGLAALPELNRLADAAWNIENAAKHPLPTRGHKAPVKAIDAAAVFQPTGSSKSFGAHTNTENAVMSNADSNYSNYNRDTSLSDPPTTDTPVIGVKPGFQTSEGQLTFLFIIVSTLLGFLGWKFSPDQIHNGYEALVSIAKIVGPIIATIPVLWNYTTSRGKTKSNAINATAGVQIAQAVGRSQSSGDDSDTLIDMTHPEIQGFLGTNKVIAGLVGGKNWKDPRRYVALSKILAQSVLPAKVGAIVDSGADIADSIVGHNDVREPAPPALSSTPPMPVPSASDATAKRRAELMAQLDALDAKPGQ